MTETLLALALTGSRAPGFNHDCASKLQSLMMALDEIAELAEPSRDPELGRAVKTAMDSMKELNTLLNQNRALTKPSVRAPIAVKELFGKASERVSVRIVGELPERSIEVAVPATTHALALVLDLAAELTALGRVVTIEDGIVRCARAASPTVLALVTFAIERDGGTVVVTPAGFSINFA